MECKVLNGLVIQPRANELVLRRFRWVFCQLQELKKSKSTRPNSVKAALLALPETLDETYERMLNNISEDDRPYALTFLRWLAYAKSPPTLDQLREASVIDPADDPAAEGVVDIDNRGGWGDSLEILAGLVITEGADEQEEMDDGLARSDVSDEGERDIDAVKLKGQVGKDTKVRLAHFSVKEYLESSRILSSNAKEFFLDPAKEHGFLTQSCLVYLMYYSDCSWKTLTTRDLAKFPLLQYAARSWYHHALLQRRESTVRELTLLGTDDMRRNWLFVHDPDHSWKQSFESHEKDAGDALYYASLLGLEKVVQMLMGSEADVNAQGGRYGNALQAASYGGREKVVQILMAAGADVNIQGGHFGNALQAASCENREKVVRMLMDAGADVNAQGGLLGNALQAASWRAHEKVVQMLMDAGADVNAQGGFWVDALQAASQRGHEKVVQMLMDAGADVNVQGGNYGSALQAAASHGGHEKVVQMLMAAGADVNIQGGHFGNALQAASLEGREKVVQMLMDAGADVNAQGGQYGNALQAASAQGHEKIVQMLRAAGAR
jgi:ankyrin repeat protein